MADSCPAGVTLLDFPNENLPLTFIHGRISFIRTKRSVEDSEDFTGTYHNRDGGGF